MAIQKVGVVGCGLMGSGIAQVCAAAGFTTVVREVSPEIVEKGLKGIEKNLGRLVEKGTITEAAKGEIRGRLRGVTSVDELKDWDVIVEAIIEQLPATKDSAHTNAFDVTLRVVRGRIVVIGCLDNLIKGASGVAVQNFNLMFGYPETTGLLLA